MKKGSVKRHSLLLIFFCSFRIIVKLLQYFNQLLGNRKTDNCYVLNNGNTLIRQIEENHCRPKHASVTDYLRIDNVADADQTEDCYLFADTLKSGLT